MEIGKQIKALRLQRKITQEELAKHLGVTSQAVSKWERCSATPDIGMLPSISAYFGVTIDALFALSDDVRMDRIQNMLWDVRYLDPSDVENARVFLLEKAKREPENGRPHELLADMENHLAAAHRKQAEEYAKESLNRDPDQRGAYSELVAAMGGVCPDWCVSNHSALIQWLKEFIAQNPKSWRAYLWLLDQLIADNRLEEANGYLEQLNACYPSYRTGIYKGIILDRQGKKEEAQTIWDATKHQYNDDWRVWLNLADICARNGQYEEAKTHYREALRLMSPPRYVDPFDSISQIAQIQGNYHEAIQALEEELEIFRTEWNFTTGETADSVRREISRLQQQIGKSTGG